MPDRGTPIPPDGRSEATPGLYPDAHRAMRLALVGLPDPMHPGIPPQFVDGLVSAQIVLSAALGHPDPGDVSAAVAALIALENRYA